MGDSAAHAACVSILARPEGRALHHGVVGRPSLLDVSILARPEGRALQLELARARELNNVSILARPEGRALPGSASANTWPKLFQSSPAPKDGRYPSHL